MNTFFKETGSTILVQDDNNNVRTEINKDNIEGILLLENDKERINNKIEELEKDNISYKKAIKKAYLRNHCSFTYTVIGGAVASIVGKSLINAFSSGIDTLALILMLYAKENSYHKFRLDKDIIEKKKQSCAIKIKNLNILKFSVNHELKIEKNANLPADRISEYKPLYNKGLVNFDILDYYEKNHDELLNYYKMYKKLPFYKDELHNRLLSDMVQKEIHDENKAYENMNLKDKVKVKVKEKVNKIIK